MNLSWEWQLIEAELMHLVGNSVVKRAVQPSAVVEMDALGYRTQCLCLSPKPHAQPILLLENAVYPFSQSVLGAVVSLGHTDAQVVLGQPIDIKVRTILGAAIGVVNRLRPLR